MKLMVCVDTRHGMLFNRRRLSSDRAVIDKILQLRGENRLWINEYSQSLFPPDADICIDPDFLRLAQTDDFFFVENVDVTPYLASADTVYLFCWNRTYPADLYFPVAELKQMWHQIYREDFSGYSHEMITLEVYRR